MKRILILFLVALAGCSEPEQIVRQDQGPQKHNGKTTSPMHVGCNWANWYNNVYGGSPPGTFAYGTTINAHFYPIGLDYYIKEYSINMTVKHNGYSNALKFYLNGTLQGFLYPQQTYTFNNFKSMGTCACGTTCPAYITVDHPYTLKFELYSGSGATPIVVNSTVSASNTMAYPAYSIVVN